MMTNRVHNSRLLQPTMFNSNFVRKIFNIWINIADPFKIVRKLILRPITNLIVAAYEEYRPKTQEKLEHTQNAVLKLIAAMIVFFLLFCGSVLMYILFYLTYMPTVVQVKPAFMQYNKICDDDARTCDFRSSVSASMHSFPQAHLKLTRKQQMMMGQPYTILIQLELPETPRNTKDLGMFMICMDMKDKDNILKSNACRSTMLRYRSPWVQTLKTLFLMPLYIFEWNEEKQILNIEMFTNYVDNTNPVSDIYIEIQSKVVEFYSCYIQLIAHFSGLRYLMFNFPIISAFFGIIINLVILLFLTLTIWYHYNYEMEWVDETKRNYLDNTRADYGERRKDSSSISATDENISILDQDEDKFELEDDILLFDKSNKEQAEE
jgi:seipin